MSRGRRNPDAPHCRGPSVLDRVRSLLRLVRHDAGCGDWFEELPPDSLVREPRRPRPGAPASSIALELPTRLDLAGLRQGPRKRAYAGSSARMRYQRGSGALRAEVRRRFRRRATHWVSPRHAMGDAPLVRTVRVHDVELTVAAGHGRIDDPPPVRRPGTCAVPVQAGRRRQHREGQLPRPRSVRSHHPDQPVAVTTMA
jgi:hypothetical protein